MKTAENQGGKRKKRKKTAARVAFDGILASICLALAFAESFIPASPFLPPGAKPGLANIAVMYAFLFVGAGDAAFLVIIKSLFVFLLSGPAAFFMSVSGGVLSFLSLYIMKLTERKTDKKASYVLISAVAAVTHNMGQAAAAGVYAGVAVVRAYLPALVLFGIASGVLTGLILKAVMPFLKKLEFKTDFF